MVMLVAAVFAAALAGAEPPPSNWPAAGERVRLTTLTSPGEQNGVVVETDAESLTVSLGVGKPPVRVPLGSVKRLEVARGRRTAVKEGAIGGGVLGTVLGVLAVTGLSQALCEGGADCTASGEGYLVGAGIFGVGGAGLGALIGLAIKKDRWERVPVGRVRVGWEPARGGVGVQVSLAWKGR